MALNDFDISIAIKCLEGCPGFLLLHSQAAGATCLFLAWNDLIGFGLFNVVNKITTLKKNCFYIKVFCSFALKKKMYNCEGTKYK
jgi:hypothetical protein